VGASARSRAQNTMPVLMAFAQQSKNNLVVFDQIVAAEGRELNKTCFLIW
jgi:hypothetical protein